MNKYKVIIVDDDDVALENLTFELSKDVRFSLEKTARNGKQAKKVITKVQPDLLFLDVEMPDMTGMELLKDIRDDVSWNMRVVFYTAYDKYMIQAIRESAFDYLLKPFGEQELKDILARFVKQAEAGQRTTLPVGMPLYSAQTFIVFTPTNDMRALRPAVTAEQITQHSPCFVQIHQSFIINIDYLMIIKDGKCILYPPFENATELLVSKKYKKELQDKYCL